VTAIGATEPEPLGDILAQMRAYMDPGHVKRAVWVSEGTGLPSGALWRGPFIVLAAGTLFAPVRLLRRLALNPSEETLARVLGYVECKSAVGVEGEADLPVVQAVTGAGWVVWEQLSSWGRVGAARRRASRYGVVRVVSMAACLARRRALIAAEVG
jgi:hypothetical protein